MRLFCVCFISYTTYLIVHILYLDNANGLLLEGIMYNFTQGTTLLMGAILLSPLGGWFNEVLLYTD